MLACRWRSRSIVALVTENKIYELEADLEKDAIKFAKRHSWLTRKFRHAGRRAAPDRWFAKGGIIFWVEFKRQGNVPSEQQYEEIFAMRGAGLDVLWIDSIEDFRGCLLNREPSA